MTYKITQLKEIFDKNNSKKFEQYDTELFYNLLGKSYMPKQDKWIVFLVENSQNTVTKDKKLKQDE